MRYWLTVALAVLVTLTGSAAMAAKPTPPPPPASAPTQPPTQGSAPGSSAYDDLVWSQSPALFLANTEDVSGRGHTVTFSGLGSSTAPNGDTVPVFDGFTSYAEVRDADDLSANNTGILTIEAWMRPDTVEFPVYEAEGYVHWMGKGVPGQHEYAMRMYNQSVGQDPTSPRPNRVSGYSFNLGGGLGAGSYFQDPVTPGEWIHVGFVIDNFHKDRKGWGTVRIYKNGVLRDTDSMGGSYKITPSNGTAPFRVGTRDFGSYFQGVITKVAVYDYDASGYFAGHVAAMK